jgi:AcrR family transcriptional regulator
MVRIRTGQDIFVHHEDLNMKNAKAAVGRDGCGPPDGNPVRERMLRAAFELMLEQGFARTSMLQIATRAQVSKRDLYALFENKTALLAEGIGARACRMRSRLDEAMPVPESRKALAAALVEVGASILRIACDPGVLMIYRLAIAESDQAPEIGRVLDENGRAANHRALVEFLKKAQARGLLEAGDPAALAARFSMVLWHELQVPLLLRVREPPGAKEIEIRARAATRAIMPR